MTVPAARGHRRAVARAPHPALATATVPLDAPAAAPAVVPGAAPIPASTVPAARRPSEDASPATTAVTPRDRAILMAVAAGRCTMSPDRAEGLLVDGRPCSDQFAGHRLLRAGLARLIAQPPGRPCTVALSPAGVALLGLPITL